MLVAATGITTLRTCKNFCITSVTAAGHSPRICSRQNSPTASDYGLACMARHVIGWHIT
jgi:hypothetical protein